MPASDRRRWPRVDVELHVVVRFSRAEDILGAVSLNISRRGVFLVTDQAKPIGTPVRLSIELDDSKQHLGLSGIVIHEATEPTAGRPRGLGIFLTKVPPEWDGFCDQLERARCASRSMDAKGLSAS